MIAKSLVRGFKGNVLFLKNLAIPKQTFRAERKAANFFQVLIEYGRQARFEGCKPHQIPTHLPTALGKTDLIGEDGSGGGDDLARYPLRIPKV